MTETYRALVLDCDGVLLDSNGVKTRAFGAVAERFGAAAGREFIRYHLEHPGVSRFDKFRHLLDRHGGEAAAGVTLETLLEDFAGRVAEGLRTCAVAPGLTELRARWPALTWMMVSAGAQSELRELFQHRGLAALFDGGIYGSPDTKAHILSRELAAGRLQRPALYAGDSRADHEAACGAGLDFVFVSDWTAFEDWQAYCREQALDTLAQLAEIDPLLERGPVTR
ncbi:MAG: HAD family hydrolase [Gammaproteobacteria bacterium]|nr:HAD family hydrolase [Gammaproteobacteria bacterium]